MRKNVHNIHKALSREKVIQDISKTIIPTVKFSLMTGESFNDLTEIKELIHDELLNFIHRKSLTTKEEHAWLEKVLNSKEYNGLENQIWKIIHPNESRK